MSRFILFAGNDYYPDGGMEDFYGLFDTVDDAIDFVKKDIGDVFHCGYNHGAWFHIVDRETLSVVFDSQKDEVDE